MSLGDAVNLTSPAAFFIARNIDIEGYFGLGTVFLVFIIVFSALIKKGFSTAVAFALISATTVAIPMRFICSSGICLFADTHLAILLVLTALAVGANYAFGE